MTGPEHILVFTDGACLGNPGPGGYGVVLIFGESRKEIWDGYRKTTNNRMEILAAIKGLECLKDRCRVTLFSDSRYLVRAVEQGWARRWRARGWMRNDTHRALNQDLWDRLLRLCEYHIVEFRWIRGHGHSNENEYCDQLAKQAARGSNLLVDVFYEASLSSKNSPKS